MKRRQEAGETPPAGLVTYRARRWPGGRREWFRARLVYARGNPAGPFGDPVDVLRAEVAAKRGVA